MINRFNFRIYRISDKKYLPINSDAYNIKYFGNCWLLGTSDRNCVEFPFICLDNNPNYIIESYIGFNDKNNIEIYEGDIIRYFANVTNTNDEYVCYHNQLLGIGFCLKCMWEIDKGFNRFFSIDSNIIEIIGNIHDK